MKKIKINFTLIIAILNTFAFIINPLSIIGLVNLFFAIYFIRSVYKHYRKKYVEKITIKKKKEEEFVKNFRNSIKKHKKFEKEYDYIKIDKSPVEFRN